MAQPTAGVGEAAADWHLIETKSFNRLSEELSLPSADFAAMCAGEEAQGL